MTVTSTFTCIILCNSHHHSTKQVYGHFHFIDKEANETEVVIQTHYRE